MVVGRSADGRPRKARQRCDQEPSAASSWLVLRGFLFGARRNQQRLPLLLIVASNGRGARRGQEIRISVYRRDRVYINDESVS